MGRTQRPKRGDEKLPACLSSHPPVYQPSRASHLPSVTWKPARYSIVNLPDFDFPITNPASAPDEFQLRCRCSYASAAGCYRILLVSPATY